MEQSYVYIMINKISTVLYVGVTSNLVERVYQHKNKLVYYEIFNDINEAIKREKQIKGGSRKKKIDLIKLDNPDLNDLYDGII